MTRAAATPFPETSAMERPRSPDGSSRKSYESPLTSKQATLVAAISVPGIPRGGSGRRRFWISLPSASSRCIRSFSRRLRWSVAFSIPMATCPETSSRNSRSDAPNPPSRLFSSWRTPTMRPPRFRIGTQRIERVRKPDRRSTDESNRGSAHASSTTIVSPVAATVPAIPFPIGRRISETSPSIGIRAQISCFASSTKKSVPRSTPSFSLASVTIVEKRTVGSIEELISFDASTSTRSRSSSKRSALAEAAAAFGASTTLEASIPGRIRPRVPGPTSPPSGSTSRPPGRGMPRSGRGGRKGRR